MTNTSNTIHTKNDNSNSKRLTKAFESKIFPHFSIFKSEKTYLPMKSSFLDEFYIQIQRIESILSSDFLTDSSIKDFYGNTYNIKTIDYKNPPEHLIEAISSHGIAKSLAYQVYKMVYSYRIETISGKIHEYERNNHEVLNFTHKLFNLSNFKKENLNPFAKLYYKYSVFLEKEIVNNALFAKVKETKPNYNVKISTPTPHIVSEIYITEDYDRNIIFFNIPNIFSEELAHLILPIHIEEDKEFDLIVKQFKNNQNIFPSILRLNNDGTITIKFEELSVGNEFFLNRRAANIENSGGSSSDYYKVKLQELSITSEDKEEYSPNKSFSLTKRRIKIEEDMKNKIDDEDFLLKVGRSKQVMHSAKNIRSNI